MVFMMRKHHHFCLQPPLFLAAVLFYGFVFGVHSSNVNGGQMEELLERVVSSLENMITFFGKDYSSVNVDGLFGIRLGQGSVNQTLTECSRSEFHCPPQLVERLESMNRYIETIAKNAMPYVESQDPEYFRHFHKTIDGPYILQYNTEVIRDIPAASNGDRDYDEEKGDMCFSSLMGQYDDEPECSIPNECWSLMTKKNKHGYVITHQLLYFILGDKTGCISTIEERLKAIGVSSIRAHETRLCAHILVDAYQEDRKGKVNILTQDLFLEQSLVCSVLGYQNFMTTDWVNMILSWQNDMGCFAMVPSLEVVETEIIKLQGEERRLLSLMKKEAENIDRSRPATGRKLLREQVMEGNCLSHKTGLAFGLVSAYIRHFVRSLYAPPDFDH